MTNTEHMSKDTSPVAILTSLWCLYISISQNKTNCLAKFSNHFHFFILQFQGLVIAGLGDLSRPAETLSISQSASLFATGLIWSRYSLVIIPKNYGLFSVNLFVAGIQFVQLLRAYRHAQAQKAVTQKE